MLLRKLGSGLTTFEELISVRSKCDVLPFSFLICEDKPEIIIIKVMELVSRRRILKYLHISTTLVCSTAAQSYTKFGQLANKIHVSSLFPRLSNIVAINNIGEKPEVSATPQTE